MKQLIPEQITPLGPDVTDEQVLSGEMDKPEVFADSEEARLLLTLVEHYDKQEEFARLRLTKELRKHLNYWNDLQYLAWDEFAHDWRTPEQVAEEDPQADIDPAVYAKVVNIYKAHGQIFIGALSSGVPTVRFFPEDANDHEDVQTAKAYSKISEIIQRHNKARLLLMKALFITYNQGPVFCYNENKEDYRFGSVAYPEMEDMPVVERNSYCPNCGMDYGPETIPMPPSDAPPEVMQALMQPQERDCPGCGEMLPPETEDAQGTQQVQVGENHLPKSRECLELYGALNVKVPMWCKDLFATPYLILETDEHVGLLREIYQELGTRINGHDFPDSWERETRVPTSYRNDFPRDQVAVKRCWFRPWAFNVLDMTRPDVQALKAKYKDGCYLVVLNNTMCVEALPDKLDDHWTATEHPLAETLHAKAEGASMIPLQDIENELTNLELETIEFGITEVFVDTQVLDPEAYQGQEVRPGQITPARAPAGKSLGEGFYELRPAVLSQEVGVFHERLQAKQQFIQGTYPSVYGGAQESSGGTAREYEMSKASALQRLSTNWIIIQEWWSKVMQKSVASFVKNMKRDEQFSQTKGSNYINIVIRRAELTGNVGDVEPEVSEAFPVSWSQKRDVILNLIQMKDETIMSVVRHPENAGMIASIIGLPELYIPGDDDRNKQLVEIAQMLQQEPMQSLQGFLSSVPVTPELDNHEVEAEVCKAWLKSEVGMDAKENNPAGYANVLAHLKEHLFFVQQAAMAAAQAQMGPENQQGEGKESQQPPNMSAGA